MNEEKKKQVAIFRFGVISDFVSPTRLDWGERARLLGEKCARQWQIPFSNRSRLSPATIRSWLRAYEKGGQRLESLSPHSRSDRGQARALDQETTLALIGLRRQMPHATVPSLIRTAQQRGVVDTETHLAQSTLWRLLKREGLMERGEHAPVDRRRFEAELPNDIWQPQPQGSTAELCLRSKHHAVKSLRLSVRKANSPRSDPKLSNLLSGKFAKRFVLPLLSVHHHGPTLQPSRLCSL